jgi:hypothetical protein
MTIETGEDQQHATGGGAAEARQNWYFGLKVSIPDD